MIDSPVPSVASREGAMISVHDDWNISDSNLYTNIRSRREIKLRPSGPSNHFLNLLINSKPSLFGNKAKTCYSQQLQRRYSSVPGSIKGGHIETRFLHGLAPEIHAGLRLVYPMWWA